MAGECVGGHSSSTDTTPPQILNLTITNITSTTATVTWETDELSDTQVAYGKTKAYANATPLDPAPLTTHTAVLYGLKSNTLFHVRAKSRDAAGNLGLSTDFTFKTDPATVPSLLLCGLHFEGMKKDAFSAIDLAIKDETTGTILLTTTVASNIKGDVVLNNAELSQITSTGTYALSLGPDGYFRQTLTGLDLATPMADDTCLTIPKPFVFGNLGTDGTAGLDEITRILSWRHGTEDPLLEEIGSGMTKRKASNRLLLLAIKAWLSGQTDGPPL